MNQSQGGARHPWHVRARLYTLNDHDRTGLRLNRSTPLWEFAWPIKALRLPSVARLAQRNCRRAMHPMHAVAKPDRPALDRSVASRACRAFPVRRTLSNQCAHTRVSQVSSLSSPPINITPSLISIVPFHFKLVPIHAARHHRPYRHRHRYPLLSAQSDSRRDTSQPS